ncbi:unnamed protein product [Lampetra fluviatilis]
MLLMLLVALLLLLLLLLALLVLVLLLLVPLLLLLLVLLLAPLLLLLPLLLPLLVPLLLLLVLLLAPLLLLLLVLLLLLTDLVQQSVYDLVHVEDREGVHRELSWALSGNDASQVTGALPEETSPLLERSFVCRCRCLLQCAAGFLKLHVRGRLRLLHGQTPPPSARPPGSRRLSRQPARPRRQPHLILVAVATPAAPSESSPVAAGDGDGGGGAESVPGGRVTQGPDARVSGADGGGRRRRGLARSSCGSSSSSSSSSSCSLSSLEAAPRGPREVFPAAPRAPLAGPRIHGSAAPHAGGLGAATGEDVGSSRARGSPRHPSPPISGADCGHHDDDLGPTCGGGAAWAAGSEDDGISDMLQRYGLDRDDIRSALAHDMFAPVDLSLVKSEGAEDPPPGCWQEAGGRAVVGPQRPPPPSPPRRGELVVKRERGFAFPPEESSPSPPSFPRGPGCPAPPDGRRERHGGPAPARPGEASAFGRQQEAATISRAAPGGGGGGWHAPRPCQRGGHWERRRCILKWEAHDCAVQLRADGFYADL